MSRIYRVFSLVLAVACASSAGSLAAQSSAMGSGSAMSPAKGSAMTPAKGSMMAPPKDTMMAPAMTPEKGGVAADFTLKTVEGKAVRLSELTSKEPVVLVVLRGYPGYQCPFCQKQVHDYMDHAEEFAHKGSQVLFVYPGPSADLDQRAKEALAKQANLPANFQLVVDPDYTVTNLYGLRWDAPHETAYPSTFVLNKKRMVLYEKVSRQHGDRSTAEDVLKEIPGAM